MAANDLLAGVADWLPGEAVSHDRGALLPSAPPLLSRYARGDCDWFTGICSVPDRVTWLATGTDRTASCRRNRRAGAMREDVTARRHRGTGCGRRTSARAERRDRAAGRPASARRRSG